MCAHLGLRVQASQLGQNVIGEGEFYNMYHSITDDPSISQEFAAYSSTGSRCDKG